MARTIAIGLVTLMLSVLGAHAHGGMTHVMGTVTAVDGSHLTIKTTDGKSVVVMLADDTKYSKEGGTASAADLKIGGRVMAEAAMGKKMNMLVAKEVRLSPSAKAISAKGADPHKSSGK